MQQFFLKSQIFATEDELMILENTVTVASLAKPDLASLVYTHCELSLACLGVTGYCYDSYTSKDGPRCQACLPSGVKTQGPVGCF